MAKPDRGLARTETVVSIHSKTVDEEIEECIQLIVDFFNKTIVVIKTDEQKKQTEEAIRGIFNIYGNKRAREGALAEWKRITTETEFFTKKRNHQVYNVYLPVDFIYERLAALGLGKKKGK